MYLKHKKSHTGQNGVIEAAACQMMDGCFTGLQFCKDAAESEEGKEALSAAAKKFKVPSPENLGEVAEQCNERKWTSHRAEGGKKLYMWALIKSRGKQLVHIPMQSFTFFIRGATHVKSIYIFIE
jgi:DIS3-like exonuclease 2